MKQAYKITFEGFEFYIDEDARLVFFEFIETSEKKFQKDPKYKKDWETFKQSIKKNLKEYITDPDKVLNLEELEKIIGIISNQKGFQDKSYNDSNKKGFERDMDSAIIAGVCSGIARLINTDISLVRVLFIILGIFTFPFGEIAYLILWAVAPGRKTNSTINYDYNNKENFKKPKSKNIDNAFSNFFHAIGNLIGGIIKSIFGLIGLALVLIGVFIILGFFNLWPWHFFQDLDFHFWDYHGHNFFNDLNQDKLLLLICVAFLIAIPIISIIYGLFKTIFGIKKKNNILKYSVLLVWFLCLLVIIGLWVSKDNLHINNKTSISQTNHLNVLNSPSLMVNINKQFHNHRGTISNDLELFNYGYMQIDGEKTIYGKPKITVTHSSNENTFELKIVKSGKTDKGQRYRYKINDISYYWEQKDSLLLLDQYFYSKDLHWWNFPEVSVEIVVPKYTNVLFTEPYQ